MFQITLDSNVFSWDSMRFGKIEKPRPVAIGGGKPINFNMSALLADFSLTPIPSTFAKGGKVLFHVVACLIFLNGRDVPCHRISLQGTGTKGGILSGKMFSPSVFYGLVSFLVVHSSEVKAYPDSTGHSTTPPPKQNSLVLAGEGCLQNQLYLERDSISPISNTNFLGSAAHSGH